MSRLTNRSTGLRRRYVRPCRLGQSLLGCEIEFVFITTANVAAVGERSAYGKELPGRDVGSGVVGLRESTQGVPRGSGEPVIGEVHFLAAPGSRRWVRERAIPPACRGFRSARSPRSARATRSNRLFRARRWQRARTGNFARFPLISRDTVGLVALLPPRGPSHCPVAEMETPHGQHSHTSSS